MFTTSGLSKGNSHEPVNPPITPLSGLPGALQLANPGHGDARPGQAVEDAVVGLGGDNEQQQEGEERFRGHCSPLLRRNLRLVVEVASGTGGTFAAVKLNTLPYLPVMYVCSKQPD